MYIAKRVDTGLTSEIAGRCEGKKERKTCLRKRVSGVAMFLTFIITYQRRINRSSVFVEIDQSEFCAYQTNARCAC